MQCTKAPAPRAFLRTVGNPVAFEWFANQPPGGLPSQIGSFDCLCEPAFISPRFTLHLQIAQCLDHHFRPTGFDKPS